MKSYKIPRISKSQVDPLTHAVEENLRQSKQREKLEDKTEVILVRETSLTPPVITNTTSNEEVLNNNLIDQVPKRVENVITRSDEVNLISKVKAMQFNPEMTISNIVRELVFHDKVIIF
jgi:maltodextrin utilization protein YvdJ